MADYDTLYIRSYESSTGKTENSSSTISGATDIHQFVDESGNVSQIPKLHKKRFKYYIDPDSSDRIIQQSCVIGASDEENGSCSFGIALGLGDDIMGMAKYE